MALTTTRPDTDAPAAVRAETPTGVDGLLGSSDHKTIGRLWVGAGLFFGVTALVISAIAGLEAIDLGGYSIVEDGDQFTQIWSLGRELLLLGAIVPILVGLGTFLVPLQIGAPAIAFARGAAGAFWTWLLATGLLITSYALNGGPGGGRLDSIVLWAVALAVMIAAICWALVVIATTILGARTVGMSLDRVPQTTWSYLIFSLIGLLSLPIIIAELVLTYVRLRHGFVPLEDRQSLAGVMAPSNLPPMLYWTAVPALGMAADIIGVHTGRPVRAHRSVMMAIGLLGIAAYGSDFFGFASIRPFTFDHGLLVVTIAAAVPAILAVLALVADSIRTGSPKFSTALIAALESGLLLLLASVAALLGLAEPVALFLDDKTPISIDLDRLLILNDTTYHDGIRGLVLGAVLVASIGALYHWAPKLWGRHMPEPLGMLALLATAAGAVVWALGAILGGIDDQPAYPVSTLGDGSNVELYNTIALVGIALVALGAVVVALAAAQSGLGRSSAGDDGDNWSGATLEWATASPPVFGNFATPPTVRSASPLADTIDAIDEAEVVADDAARAGGEAAAEQAADASEEGAS